LADALEGSYLGQFAQVVGEEGDADLASEDAV